MLRTGLYVLNGLPPVKGTPKGEVKPTPVGPIAAFLMIIVSAAFLVITISSGLTVMLCVATPLVLAGLVFGGVLATGACESYESKRKLDHMPSAPTLADQAVKTTQIRARAAQTPAGVSTTVLDAPKPPAAVSVPLQRVQEDTAAILAVRERVDERLLRVAALVAVTCPFCGAGEGASCETIGAKMYLIDQERGIAVHLLRIIKAVSTGAAKLDDVTAQFNGNTPEELWGAIV